MDFDFLERGNKIGLKFYYVSKSKSGIGLDAYLTGNRNIEKVNTSFKPLLSLTLSGFIFFGMLKVLKRVPIIINNKYIDKDKKGKGIVGCIATIPIIGLVFGLFFVAAKISVEIINFFSPF